MVADCAEEGEDSSATTLKYEQDDEVAKYARFYFDNEEINGIPNFPVACAKICLDACKAHGVSMLEAMDAGCGPGRLGKPSQTGVVL